MINNGTDRIISIKALEKLNGVKYILIDIREKYKYKSGHIPSAVSMTESEIINNLDDLRQYEKVIIYCDYGNAGLRLVNMLANNYDMNNVYNIVGGYNVYRGKIKKG